MRIIIILSILFLSSIIIECKKEDTDKEKPSIDISFPEAFPKNCDTLFFGEQYVIKLKFSDNLELGSYSINIHHNFDHHTHTTEMTICQQDSVKTPINPYKWIYDYTIPEGQKTYETDLKITLPSSNINGLYDEGDYHFFISLTDRSGWSTVKGLSIKLKHK